MEGYIGVLAGVGGISLYLVVMALVSRGIYAASKGNRDDRITWALIGGLLWPLVVPAVILVFWIYSILRIPLDESMFNSKEEKELTTCIEELNEAKKTVKDLKNKDVKSVFKVGDEITGVVGNPDEYNVLYEGCVCRVLKVDGDKPMKLILIGHKDKEAHQNKFGKTYTAPARNFRLINAKKEASNKKPTKKK